MTTKAARGQSEEFDLRKIIAKLACNLLEPHIVSATDFMAPILKNNVIISPETAPKMNRYIRR